MSLLHEWLDITARWRDAFTQERTAVRAVRQGLGSLVCLGRRTITRALWACGRENLPWQAEYHLYGRAKWDPQQLFDPIWDGALPLCGGPLVGVAIDDTKLHKTGRCIVQAFHQRDPLSPPFHTNLILGLRFLQASLLVPLHHAGPFSCRALPVRFEESSPARKPGKRASDEDWEAYKQSRKENNLSTHCVKMIGNLRASLDAAGATKNILVASLDGSFCNRTVFGAERDRTQLIARTRKNAKLCHRAPEGSRRFYAQEKFTPEQVRQDDTIAWATTKIFYGGKRRKVRYKEIKNLYWQGGARRLPLRLFVVAPTPYRKRKSSKRYYRQPAYLLCTDMVHAAQRLLQIYFDRWQIEVNHREEKDTLGVGQAQLWNPNSVPKQPPLAVAAYSALLLAALKAFGPERNGKYAPLPRWRKHATRPSCLDLITLLRKEMDEQPQLLQPLGINTSRTKMASAAAA
ncbi:MAG: transposase [Candidatus Hydrogenedentes bacterium]|nr:transposase [Candidatus Hydrogenedentota bacterium]MBX3179736.1 transposase [Candidatus Hydrogenedentota bacterium]